MLENFEAIATIAVKDIGVATDFYEQTLGLSRIPTGEPRRADVQERRLQDSGLRVSTMPAPTKPPQPRGRLATTSRHVVAGLAARGVRFEHYDLPGTTLDGDSTSLEPSKPRGARIRMGTSWRS